MSLPWKILLKIISTVFSLAVLASPFAFKFYLGNLPTPKVNAQQPPGESTAEPTGICGKLGVNLAITAENALNGAITAANSINSQFTEVLVTGVGPTDLADILKTVNTNNQQTIIRLGAGRNSENISAGEWANFLNSVNSQSNKPIIATAGHNEPYCAEARSLQEESQYIQTVAGGTDANVTLLTGQLDIYCPLNSSGPTQTEYFETISNIPGIDAVAMPFYTEVGGQSVDEAVALFQAYMNVAAGKKIYITEVGADPNNEGTGDPALLREALNRILADPQILAALVFNGLCQNPGFAYTSKYCSPECLPLVSGCSGGQTVSEAELTALATQCATAGPRVRPTRQGEELYIHPENLEEIKAGYQVTSGRPDITQALRNGNDFICQFFGGCIGNNLTQNVIYSVDANSKVPWYNQERQLPLLRSGSAATFWGADFDNPNAHQELDAPYYKGSNTTQQCEAKRIYLEHLDILCQNYEAATGTRCILPRPLPNSPYGDELDFYLQRDLRNLNCQSQPLPLSQTDTALFDAIIPQIRDGVEFKIAYWLNYVPKPNRNLIEAIFKIDDPNPQIKIARFLVPVTNVAGQANQSEYPDDPEFQESYIDSLMTKTANLLKPRRFVEQNTAELHGARVQSAAAANSASFSGPCVNAETLCDQIDQNNLLTCTLIQKVNAQPHCPENQTGETADLSFTRSRFLDNFLTALRILPLQGFVDAINGLNKSIERIQNATINPFAQGEAAVEEQNFIIAPEETLLANQTTKETLLSSFYPQDRWEQTENNLSDFSQMVGPNSEYRSSSRSWSRLIDTILESFTVSVGTANSALQASIFGRPQLAATHIAGNFLRPQRSQGSLHNSPCEGVENESDCYWKGNWTPQTTTFSTPSQIPPGSPQLPTVTQGTCIAPQPEEALSLIQQAQSDPQKYPYAPLVDDQILQAIYTIEGFTHYETGNTTCTKNPFTALGLMQITDPTYNTITTATERASQEENICQEVPGKLNRCNPLDAIELAARTLIVKKYGGLPDPAGLTFTAADAYTYSAFYYNSACPDTATTNLAVSLQRKGLISQFRNNTNTAMSYPDLVCALIGTCPPYPPRPEAC